MTLPEGGSLRTQWSCNSYSKFKQNKPQYWLPAKYYLYSCIVKKPPPNLVSLNKRGCPFKTASNKYKYYANQLHHSITNLRVNALFSASVSRSKYKPGTIFNWRSSGCSAGHPEVIIKLRLWRYLRNPSWFPTNIPQKIRLTFFIK